MPSSLSARRQTEWGIVIEHTPVPAFHVINEGPEALSNEPIQGLPPKKGWTVKAATGSSAPT